MREGSSLARDAIGLVEVAFQGVAHMGPAVAITSAVPFAFVFAGGSAPLAIVFAFGAALLVASSMAQLAKHIPSAGGLYAYAANGLHPSVGFFVAWAYGLAEAVVSPLLYLLLSLTIADQLHADLGWPASLWWVWALLLAAMTLVIGLSGIRVSVRVGVILGAVEIAVFAALSLWLIVAAGERNTLLVFGTGFATKPGLIGPSGVLAASVFTVLAYIGFEAVVPMAEEARKPGRTVRLGLLFAVVGVGLLFALAAYAASVYFGPSRGLKFAGFNNGNPWILLARQVWGIGWVVVFLVVVQSYVANVNAASIAITRTWYAMGRIQLLPQLMASVEPGSGVPRFALISQVGLALLCTLTLGFSVGPLIGALIAGTLVTETFVPIYMIVSLACISYYRRYRPTDFHPLWNGLLPGLAILLLIPVFLAGAGVPSFSFVETLTPPLSYVGPMIGIWMLLGLAYFIYLRASHPERLRDTGRLFVEPDGVAHSGGH